MAVMRRFDFILNGQGYMLARGQYKGRAWQRTGMPDSPGQRTAAAAKYGQLPDEIDHPEVWDDWSGGFGMPYRRNGENTYHWAENFDARWPRQLVHAQQPQRVVSYAAAGEASAVVNVNDFSEGGALNLDLGQGKGAVYLFGRSQIWTRTPYSATEATPFGESFSYVHASVLSIQFINPATFGSYIYIGDFASSGFQPWRVDETGIDINWVFVGGGPGIPNGTGFATVGNRLWRSCGPPTGNRRAQHYLQSLAAGAVSASPSNWSATLNVGHGNQPILRMIGMGDQLFCGLPDGLYAGDQTGTFVNVLAGMGHYSSWENCRDLTVWNNGVVAPYVGGIYHYSSQGQQAGITDVSPPDVHRAPLHGHVRAVKGYNRWLYAGLYNGSYSYLLVGERQIQGMVWHTLQKFPNVAKVGRLYIDGITVASNGKSIPVRMWAAMDHKIATNGTAPVYFWPIPPQDGNPLLDDSSFVPNYCGSARIDLGAVDWGAPSTPKVFRSVEIWANNLASSAQWCKVYYTVDESASRALLGTVAKSPKDTLYFPTGSGNWVTGQSIALSIESFTASARITPIYRAIVLRGALRPRSVDQITAVVRIADGVRDRQGSEMRSGATMLAELRALAQSNTPVPLVDLAGATSYVEVLAPVEEADVYQQGEENPEIAATVRMSVLSFS